MQLIALAASHIFVGLKRCADRERLDLSVKYMTLG